MCLVTIRSSQTEVFCKNRCSYRNFAKCTRKHLRLSLFFNKVAGKRPATLLKKENLTQMFSSNFCQICKNAFFTQHLRETASLRSCIKGCRLSFLTTFSHFPCRERRMHVMKSAQVFSSFSFSFFAKLILILS